jgi:hypothetical protein
MESDGASLIHEHGFSGGTLIVEFESPAGKIGDLSVLSRRSIIKDRCAAGIGISAVPAPEPTAKLVVPP